ncbi:replication factor C small subunit [Candidatus Marsarchaeota G2 archaeon OSP_D]|jgi:DNA polymerase III, gamma/tau subunits|uniref:Replication factor C small subunit n=6 Tax=Candidatus Marsarchaeota group 2 TaxID=2203771 RepID=A0A2R6CDX0_9ARCH|nr:MAG: replication factor C small subunit [Candidatus Marsarchaeota G2 archaeon OSP_D]PSN96619.1 MAG: replication factor C small subunit [Candidatus Marsarchaeota G2 archaeon ECH_B_2]PSO00424.1 MAG: replication factor C small subunit [Candidatus Marsarchaeota G2 archaeon ECH_B_3]PSO03320.1 MAG: replication factor C small subunit [Candidatus Marsarchaeota G2 archaeon ECH_B_1]PSO08976.1 MAG: replication factor C small subunit [Candidatus Marsarchaeota G2 archaeon BE_D]
MSSDEEMIWTEKYRPKKLDDLVGNDAVVLRLKQFARQKNMPHCLFIGPAGVGKTTAAICLSRDILGEHFREGYLELNASSDNRIDVVRTQIKDYARTTTFSGIPFKILVLDEADNMTPEAQQALRRTMEIYSNVCRFILIANYSNRIIEPIQSRCAVFRFTRLSKNDVVERLRYIAEQEGLKYDREGLEAIYDEHQGDLRMCINTLQSLAVLNKKVDKQNVLEVLGSVYLADISQIIDLSLEGKFNDARRKLQDVLYLKAIPPEDVVRQIYREIVKSGLPDKVKVEVLGYLGEVEFRLVQGSDGEVQLDALLAKMASIKK